MTGALSTARVARLLGMSEARVRSLVRSGLCRPARSGRAYSFSFQDLVVLYAARRLLRQGVPLARVRRSLSSPARELPQGESLSGLRIEAAGAEVTVRQGGARWNPETGQALLDFEVSEVEELVREFEASERGAAAMAEASASPRESDAAEAEFRRALALEPSDPKAARDAYQRALRLDPDLADALVNLGRLAHQEGDAHEAARLYHMALERDALDPIVHFNLALALEDTSGPEPAISHYQRAIELDADFADAHFNLAGLCEQLGRAADALRHYHAYKQLQES